MADNKYIINLIILSYIMITLFHFPQHKLYGAEFPYKIEVDDSHITSCPLDIGNVSDCFDGSLNTLARTIDVTPAWIQVEFPAKRPVRKIRFSLGQPGYYDMHHNWFLEAADTESDMENKTGSYELVVPERPNPIGKEWTEFDFDKNVTKKIWRFYAKKTWGDNHVHIPEIEFYSYYTGSKLDLKGMMDDGFINSFGEVPYEKNIANIIDENPNTSLQSSSGNKMSFILGFSSRKIRINQIRVLAGTKADDSETDKLIIEAADELEDFNTKSGSYKLIFDKGYQMKYDDWQYIDLFEQTNRNYWKINMERIDSQDNVHLSELEFWIDKYYDGDSSIPKNVKVAKRKDHNVEITWDKSDHISGFVSYNVFRNDVLIARTTENKYIDSIPNYGYYFYNVSANNPMGVTSGKSDSLELMITQNSNEFVTSATDSQSGVQDSGDAMVTIDTSISITPTPTPSADLSPTMAAGAGNAVNHEKKPENSNESLDDDRQSDKKNEIKSSDSDLINKIIVFIIIVIGAVLFFFSNKMILIRKRRIIEKKKRDMEMQGIKKLIEEKKADHLIELFNKSKK